MSLSAHDQKEVLEAQLGGERKKDDLPLEAYQQDFGVGL